MWLGESNCILRSEVWGESVTVGWRLPAWLDSKQMPFPLEGPSSIARQITRVSAQAPSDPSRSNIYTKLPSFKVLGMHPDWNDYPKKTMWNLFALWLIDVISSGSDFHLISTLIGSLPIITQMLQLKINDTIQKTLIVFTLLPLLL